MPADKRRGGIDDSTRDRTVLINQLALTAVAVIAILFALGLGQVTKPQIFISGAALIFIGAGAAVLVPWKMLHYAVSGILPVLDIFAVAMLRDAAPTAGLGLLWAFPAMWIASVFGVIGVIGAFVSISTMFWLMVGLDPTQPVSASTILLPITIGALATISYLASRRAQAQRQLLDKQSRHLEHSVERARRQEELVTEVLDAVDFGVIRVTPEGTLVVTNEAHARLQGSFADAKQPQTYSADGITSLQPDELPIVRAREGESFDNELVWYGAPGERGRALSVTARPLTDPDGTPAGAIIVSRDVTKEEQVLRAREDLIASVSHELRTPLTSVIGYLDLALDRDDIPEGARGELDIAARNAGRLLELVADILAVSASARHGGELSIAVEPTDVSAIARAAIESEDPRACERRIVIDGSGLGPPEGAPILALADPRRIRQVIDNLLTNAVKYHHDGGKVSVTATSDGVHVWVAVRDDGPGIAEEEMPLLFDRFFRADAVRNSTTHGSGLGLAISRDIVRAHGGEILVHSRPGHGSTFTVRLPAAPLHEEDGA